MLYCIALRLTDSEVKCTYLLANFGVLPSQYLHVFCMFYVLNDASKLCSFYGSKYNRWLL